MGAAAALGCLAIGIGPWLLIGLFVVVASLIPVFGPYIGAIPAVLVALISPTHIHSPVGAAVAVVLLFVVINEVGGKVLYPNLLSNANRRDARIKGEYAPPPAAAEPETEADDPKSNDAKARVPRPSRVP